jgi:8-oxo-dGTP pyrophosphatase MutT (NUDIX family)
VVRRPWLEGSLRDVVDEVGDAAESWPVERSEDLYRSGLPFALRADVVRRPGAADEEPFTRVVLEHPGAAVILAVDDEDRVLCLRQYRHPAGKRMLELPAGLLDVAGEEPQAAAERELLEEAGLAARDWTPLASVYSSPGISSELIHYFLARGLTEADRGDFVLAHEEADMVVLWVPYAELVAAVLDGRVQDAPVLIAVLTARSRGLIGNEATKG